MNYLQQRIDDQRRLLEDNHIEHPFLQKAHQRLDLAQEMLDAGLLSTGRQTIHKSVRFAWEALFGYSYHLLLMALNEDSVKRDIARQEGTRKPRRPLIDQYIDKQLERNPDAKSPSLYRRAPEWLTDQIGPDRFSKRVTAGRKRQRVASN